MYPDGIPDPEKFGFIGVGSIGRSGDFTGEVKRLCGLLQRDIKWTDKEGYEWEILAAAIGDAPTRYAWLEVKAKEIGEFVDVQFYLKGMAEGAIIFDWEVETYNPFFGCQPEFLQWVGLTLVFIYHEKHHTYICSFSGDKKQKLAHKPIKRHRLSDEWSIFEGTLFYSGEVVDQVERMSLPGLELLEPWSAQRAREQGALPPGYDETNEWHRQYQKRAAQVLPGETVAQRFRRLMGWG